MKHNQNKRIIAIDISSRGFGFAVMEGKDQLVDWGVKNTQKDKHDRTISLMTRLVELYRPEVVVIQESHEEKARRTFRVVKLLEELSEIFCQRSIEVQKISWKQVQKTFLPFHATTKHQIASTIAELLPELAPRLPPFRKCWMSEDYRMSIFDAVAFGLTFYHRQD